MIRKIYKNLAFMISATGNSLFLLPIFRTFKGRYPRYALQDSDICIEGYPRSGNSFFVAAFQVWNPGASIAHHTHLASNAKYSVKQGKPTVILVREPAQAIASAIVWDGRLVPTVGLITYMSFYRSLERYKQDVLFLDFHEAVNRPDLCIDKINRRFGSCFSAIEFNSEENNRIQGILINQDVRIKRTELSSTLPNDRKATLKKAIVKKIKENSLFMSAQNLYDDYKEIASTHGESDLD